MFLKRAKAFPGRSAPRARPRKGHNLGVSAGPLLRLPRTSSGSWKEASVPPAVSAEDQSRDPLGRHAESSPIRPAARPLVSRQYSHFLAIRIISSSASGTPCDRHFACIISQTPSPQPCKVSPCLSVLQMRDPVPYPWSHSQEVAV